MAYRGSGLCLLRRKGQALDIDNGRIVVVVDKFKGSDGVILRVIADKSISVMRQEVVLRNKESAGAPAA